MWKFAGMALKNVARNRKRTLITLGTILIGVLASMMARAMIGAAQTAIIKNVTQGLTGDFQIHKTGYVERTDISPLDITIQQDGEIENILLRQGALIARRIHFGGLLYPNDESSTVFKAVAIEPAKEKEVCPLIEKSIFEGRYLSDERSDEIVLSKGLATGMNVSVGDTILIVGNDRNSSMNMKEVEIVGVFESILPGIGNKMAYLNLVTARNFLDMAGESTELAVRAGATLADSRKVYEKLKATATKLDVELHFWDEVAKLFSIVIIFQEVFANLVVVIFFIMVTTAIVNTMIMAVFERVNEIGMMRAMGIKRNDIKKLFVFESLILGTIGGAAGVLIASVIIAILNIVGISIVPPGSSVSIDLHPAVSITSMVYVFSFAVGMSLIAALYPASIAAKWNPIEAIRDE
ncbi:MAG: FtsX-like permease family protein [Chitinivibrionales bacterium]|nr:FtsX-like permease family protein [Chitinivibrionales bacterium]